MAYELYKWPLQKGASVTINSNYNIINFGGGYTSTMKKDPLGGLKVFSFSYTHKHNSDEINERLAFLERHTDGTPFYIQDFVNDKPKRYTVIITDLKVTRKNNAVTTFTCKLQEVRQYETS